MAEDFYIDDYGGGSYYDGGGGGGGYDYGYDFFGGGDDFYYGYGFDQLTETPPIDPVADEFFMGDDFNYGYGFDSQEPITVGSDDLFLDYLDYYLGQGYDGQSALDLADAGAATGQAAPIVVDTYTPYLPEPVLLPDIRPFELPYIPTPFDPFQFQPPSIPFLPEPPPAPPSLPQTSTPRLPPACAGGTYHPYPIGHPQQDICIPFPSAPPQQQQRPPGQQQQQPQQQPPRPPAQQPRPPQQQPCPTGQYRDPATGQCKPIPQGQPQQCPTGYYRASNGQCLPIPRCTTPGTVFDAARGLCVPRGQAVSPLPNEVEDLLTNLKDLPWWVWAALGGAVLLSMSGEGGETRRSTTSRYRRAS